VALDRAGEQSGDVGAGARGVVEVGGQPRPERVVGDAGINALGEAAPALCARLAEAQRGVDAAADELLEGRGAVGVLVGAGDAGVGRIDVVGGAEHRDLGHQLGLVGQQWARPGGHGRGLPFTGCGADLLGQIGDQVGVRIQVGAPLRVAGERVGDRCQPTQRPDPLRGRSFWWLQSPVQQRGDVDGIAQRFGRGLVEGLDWVVTFAGQQGQASPQHRPRGAFGDVDTDRAGGGVDMGHGGRSGGVFGGRGERVGVHGGCPVQPDERVVVGGSGVVGRDLRAAAAQDRREDVHGGRRMGGCGCQDAVGVGFGGGEVEVVFVLAAGQRQVELWAGEPIGAHDVAGAFDVAPAGGDALGAVDGAGVAQCVWAAR
jgi:hypothetical protein